MTKTEHHKPTNFVGLYFVDEEGSETGQIIAEISDGYYLAQFDASRRKPRHPDWKCLSSADFNRVCDSCGERHWRFVPDVESQEEVDHLVEYARSGKRQDGQSSASQTKARPTGVKPRQPGKRIQSPIEATSAKLDASREQVAQPGD